MGVWGAERTNSGMTPESRQRGYNEEARKAANEAAQGSKITVAEAKKLAGR